jgi:hypothetical protein
MADGHNRDPQDAHLRHRRDLLRQPRLESWAAVPSQGHGGPRNAHVVNTQEEVVQCPAWLLGR